MRATAGPPAARLASPAYLAIDGPERLRLQVLSPFGVTVLDLATDGDTLRPHPAAARRNARNGRIDLAALAAGTTPEDERMIVALALLFRPKMSDERPRRACRAAGPATVTCTIAPDLAATITVDDALRPVREEYVGAPRDRPSWSPTSATTPTTAPDALPGRITISDGQGGPALVRPGRPRPPELMVGAFLPSPAGPLRDTVAVPCSSTTSVPPPGSAVAWCPRVRLGLVLVALASLPAERARREPAATPAAHRQRRPHRRLPDDRRPPARRRRRHRRHLVLRAR